MKKIIKSTLMLFIAVCALTACDDDLDNNPVLQTPDSFKLNKPAYAALANDLASTPSLEFTWLQPDYGFTAAATYEVQLSTKNDWTISVDKAAEDETGETLPTFVTVGSPTGECAISIAAADVAKAIMQMEKYEEDAVPESQTVYARIKSELGTNTIYSNVVAINTIPYYVELSETPIELWYAVGNFLGEGWKNDAENVGSGLLPLFPAEDAEFDKKTGQGPLSTIMYVPEGGQFKFIKTPGSWDDQKNFNAFFGEGGTDANFEGNSDGNLCLKEGKAGFYEITLNTVTGEATIAPAEDVAGTIYQYINIPGSHNDWSPSDGSPMTLGTASAGGVCHVWKANLTLQDDAVELKFAADHDWAVNWGATGFPYGIGVQNGSNIVTKKGDYTVFFNDLTGQYMFISK